MNNTTKILQFIQVSPLKLAVYEWGKSNPEQETIILLHGYPDSAEVWDRLAEKLSKQFHVISYDVRGTGLSDIPTRQKHFHSDYLIEDLEQVIAATSPNKKVHAVSYDWGSLQAWEGILGDRLKDRGASYTAMTPSLDAIGWWFRREVQKNNLEGFSNVIKRLTSSCYMVFFQLPVIPELSWRAGLYKVWPKFVAQLQKTTVPISKNMLKDALHSIALYRENMIKPFFLPSTRKTTIPTHFLILTKDTYVSRAISESMREWVENIEYTEIEAGHWVMLSHAEQLVQVLTDYIGRHSLSKNTA